MNVASSLKGHDRQSVGVEHVPATAHIAYRQVEGANLAAQPGELHAQRHARHGAAAPGGPSEGVLVDDLSEPADQLRSKAMLERRERDPIPAVAQPTVGAD